MMGCSDGVHDGRVMLVDKVEDYDRGIWWGSMMMEGKMKAIRL
jgi:hypothetical protein